MGRRHAIPGLGRPVVQIVDPVEIHVLDVPREGRLPHPEVEVGALLHPGQPPPEVVKYWLVLAHVPDLLVLVHEGGGHVRAVDGIVSPVYEVVAPVELLQLLVTLVRRRHVPLTGWNDKNILECKKYFGFVSTWWPV